MSRSNCCFLTYKKVSQEVGKVFWFSHLLKNFPQFVFIHTIKEFSIVNEAEEYVFLVFPCFLCDPADDGNLISGSSAFSKSSLKICKFSVHVLLKPSLKNFEHYLASVWNKRNFMVLWTFFGIAFFVLEWKLIFSSCGNFWVFQICWRIECSTFTATSFRIWNSSAEIPSPPLALFLVMLPKAHLT